MTAVECREVTTLAQFIDAIRIRVDVYIIEQGWPPGWEPDDLDKVARHFIALLADTVVATARVREEPLGNSKIECMAVRKEFRGTRVGTELTRHIIRQAAAAGHQRLWLESQVRVRPFYEKCGFRAISTDYDRWNFGVPHVMMELTDYRIDGTSSSN